ncbi:MAG: flagellar biosynthetic protein FliQ [Defluviitaleaceae bacterium]|nr:flagellar biosynthetic protein FliQ [Defluviitaleaceae bacterium]
MNEDLVLTIVQRSLLTVILVAGPVLIVGLTVGVLVSIIQTMTSIQEPTMSFVPKILAVLASIIFFGPFMLGNLMALANDFFGQLPYYIIPLVD